jgi:hypothetical protein
MRDQRTAQRTPTDSASDEATRSIRDSLEAPVRRIALDPDLGARNRLTDGIRHLTGRFEGRVARSKKKRAQGDSDQFFPFHRVRLTTCRSAANAEVAFERTTAAKEPRAKPAASRRRPPASERPLRSSAATAD